MAKHSSAVVHQRILGAIVEIRHHKVLLDSDLASLYGVTTKALVQAVKRNVERFPPDFMFQLSPDEFANLRSQNVTSSSWGGRRTAPYGSQFKAASTRWRYADDGDAQPFEAASGYRKR